MSNNLKYQLALFHAPEIGNKAYHQLIELLKSHQMTLQNIFEKPALFDEIIHKTQLNQKKINQLKFCFRQPAWEMVEDDLIWAEKKGNFLISSSDQNYPQLLKQQHTFPIVLYVMGNPLLLSDIQIAMVGSRTPSPTATENAFQFAHYLAQNGMVITSGLALGIDAASHRGALQASGKTIAVAGTGIDRVYPAKHIDLAHKIVDNGAIVSEFPLGTAPLRQNFPKRNQIISGLSVGTLVVEAALKSGSLITARIAMEQGREVFAIPGSIHNPLAKGCHYLIKQGAKLVENADDIIEEIKPLSFASSTLQQKQNQNIQKTVIDSTLPKDQQLLLQYIDDNPVTIDQLQQRCQISIEEINSLVVLLEIQGYIQSLPGGKIILSHCL